LSEGSTAFALPLDSGVSRCSVARLASAAASSCSSIAAPTNRSHPTAGAEPWRGGSGGLPGAWRWTLRTVDPDGAVRLIGADRPFS
jgi:hypothetical protein